MQITMNSPQGLFGNLVQNQLGFSRTTIGRSLGNLNTLQENKNKNATKQNLKNLELEKKEPHIVNWDFSRGMEPQER